MITIPAGSSPAFGAGGKYLNVFTASRSFEISNKAKGLNKTRVKAGYSYELGSINEITIHNDSDDALNVDFEISDLRTIAGGNSGVDVNNEPWIAGMRNPIDVNANATVENGKMAINVAQHYAPIDDVTIPANGIVKFASARIAQARTVTIQVITDSNALPIGEVSKVRLGDKNTLTATQGIFLQGDSESPAGYEWETETDVFIRNMTGNAVTVTGGETWR